VGFICQGSLSQVDTCCKSPNCRCADPARRYGAYWLRTWKEAGKVVSRRLSAEETSMATGPTTARRMAHTTV
jgi:hypothetical protein